MGKIIWITLLVIQGYILCAQKISIDTSVFHSWPQITRHAVTQNGKYLYYVVENKPAAGEMMVVIKSSDNHAWRLDYISTAIPELEFSRNGKYLMLKIADSLIIYRLGTDNKKIITQINDWKLSTNSGSQWIIYSQKTAPQEINLKNLDTDKMSIVENVNKYSSSPDGKRFLFEIANNGNKKTILYDLISQLKYTVWNKSIISDCIWQRNSENIFFVTAAANRKLIRYSLPKQTAEIIDSSINESVNEMSFEKISHVSEDGDFIFLNYVKKDLVLARYAESNCIIWRSQDISLIQPDKPREKRNVYCYNTATGKMILVQADNEKIELPKSPRKEAIILTRYESTINEVVQFKQPREQISVVSFIYGTRVKLDMSLGELSPGGKFVTGNSILNGHYLIYNLDTKKYFDLNEAVASQIKIKSGNEIYFRSPNWLSNDSSLLISDEYDIWQISFAADGNIQILCLTNGYARKNNIDFDIIANQKWDHVIRTNNNKIILKGRSRNTYSEGFYQILLSKKSDPKELFSGPYVLASSFQWNFSKNGQFWPESKQSSYLVERQTGTNSNNIFLTKDFKKFTRVSDVYPEKKYNWLTKELVRTTSADGSEIKSLLYRPENFSANKRYPVIIYYYEEMSQGLNEFNKPEPCGGGLNIPWLVAQGYIVCTPDIINNKHTPGKTALNAVLSVYEYLKNKTWIDSTKIGIGGHSFGGLETNYILTHTNVFAAAYTGASIDNVISFGGTMEGEWIKEEMVEFGQFGLGESLWQNREKHIDNSAIFNIDKVTAPVLIMHNSHDTRVPFEQGLEFFLALRRLQKKAWLLNYQNEGHTINEFSNQLDFTIRLVQFYDHFLKGNPAPDWMIK
jgi:acetyl esterase/lipase